MKLAYLVNQYPMVSLSFIRREIAGIEAQDVPVARFAIRRWHTAVVDEADKREVANTRYVLDVGGFGLLKHLLQVLVTRSPQFFSAFRLACTMGWSSERGLFTHWIYLAEACVLLHWFNAAAIDHVHVHFGTNSTAVALLCRVLGGPAYSFTVHGPEEFDKPGAIALPEKINHAAMVIAVCSFGKSQIYRWCHYKQWGKIQVVHCGVDDSFLSHSHVPLPSTPRFVCVGRLNEQKGHLLLVSAVSQLAAEGLTFKLAFVGDGPLREQIEHLITQLHLEDYIEITGWATNAEVKQQILASQALVAPSFAEGLPVVIMEALALARPVVSTYIAGIPELVEPGKCGWLVPAGSVSGLADAMRAVLKTPLDTLESMGKAGSEQVAKHHNAHVEAERLLTLLQDLPSVERTGRAG